MDFIIIWEIGSGFSIIPPMVLCVSQTLIFLGRVSDYVRKARISLSKHNYLVCICPPNCHLRQGANLLHVSTPGQEPQLLTFQPMGLSNPYPRNAGDSHPNHGLLLTGYKLMPTSYIVSNPPTVLY